MARYEESADFSHTNRKGSGFPNDPKCCWAIARLSNPGISLSWPIPAGMRHPITWKTPFWHGSRPSGSGQHSPAGMNSPTVQQESEKPGALNAEEPES